MKQQQTDDGLWFALIAFAIMAVVVVIGLLRATNTIDF